MKTIGKNLSEGNVIKNLVSFSLPFLISNLIQTLYNVADLIIVGRFCNPASIAGVSNGSQVQFLITNMAMGFTVGGTVLVAQYLGANKKEDMKKTVSTLFTALIYLALIITIVMIFKREFLLKLIKTPKEAFIETNSYFIITSLGTIFIFGYNVLNAIMRGMGDSKTPLIFVTIACFTNIFLDLIFVGKFGLGVQGAAIATVISQGMSMFLCIWFLKKRNFIFDFSIKSFKIHKDKLKLLLKLGIPTSAQNVIVGVSFLFLTTMANTFGVYASAAVGAITKLNGFAILPSIAISSSVSAMCAQNLGAGKLDRAKETLRAGIIFSLGLSFVIFFIIRLFPEECIRLFSNDRQMLSAGTEYLLSFSYDYILVPIEFCLNGLFIGAGYSLFAFFTTAVASLFVRIPACYILGLKLNMGLVGLGLGAPLATLVGLIIATLFYFSGKWKKILEK